MFEGQEDKWAPTVEAILSRFVHWRGASQQWFPTLRMAELQVEKIWKHCPRMNFMTRRAG